MAEHVQKDIISMDHRRVRFMRSVMADVWEQLEKDGYSFTFGEIKERFIAMMKDDEVHEAVKNVFMKRY